MSKTIPQTRSSAIKPPSLEFFRDRNSIDAISGDDLTRFVVSLKKDHVLGSNTIPHNAIIVAQFSSAMAGAGSRASCNCPNESARFQSTTTRRIWHVLCGLLRYGARLVRHVPDDWFP